MTEAQIQHFLHSCVLRKFNTFFGLGLIEKREHVYRFNNTLSIDIFDERNTKHHRPHAHIMVNGSKVGMIWLDTWEVETQLRKETKEIEAWLQDNKEKFIEIWEKHNGKIEIGY